MRIILLEDIKGKGKKDQIITAADGYCNFLIKQNKALSATTENLHMLEQKLEKAKIEHEKKVVEAKLLKNNLESTQVKFFGKLTPKGTLTRKITSRDIALKLNEEFNSAIDKHRITLSTDLDTPGKHLAKIKLYDNITANITILILCE